ncbi:DNRLRE domain-containing protein [Thermococcus stetteri]|uniref:DNRLRE domain-containing protein n=1 Tax=Thermococcus stetteri TaxID=49900 RepID=UPI001AE6D69C|nr:DNRLRE domain-containing protein [Thermococcus stetteri]MBP1913042.1 hypothetical protein [Thermococcus stetteri]
MKRSALMLVALLILSLIPAWAIKPVAAVQTSVQLPPTDDAYVYEKYPDSNYRDKDYIWVGYYNGGEVAFLKFNLSSLPKNAQIQSAEVCLYDYGLYGTPVISAHAVSDDSWTEDTITWNNAPSWDKTAVDTVTLKDRYTFYCWNVTSLAISEFNGDKILSIALVSDNGDSAKFDSKEYSNSTKRPKLEIVYEVPNKPSLIPLVSIQEIQSNTINGDNSTYQGQRVTTGGVVTALTKNGIFIQDGTGPWSGIYVYLGSTPSVNIGDLVQVTGTVKEYYGFTEITDVTKLTKLGTAEVPAPVVLKTGEVAQEQWESVLVKVEDVTVTNPDLGDGEWEIDDGSGPLIVDDLMYKYNAMEGQRLKYVTGIVYYSYGNFKIEPRSADDISEMPKVFVENVTFSRKPYVGEKTNVTLEIKNYDQSEHLVDLVVKTDDEVLYDGHIRVFAGSERNFTTQWTPETPGTHVITAEVYDGDVLVSSYNTEVNVDYGVLLNASLPSAVFVEEPVSLNFTVLNNYTSEKNVTLEVRVQGDLMFKETRTLEGQSAWFLSLPWMAPTYGTYPVSAVLYMDGIPVRTFDDVIHAQYSVIPVTSEKLPPVEDAYSYYHNGTDFSWRNYYTYYDKYELAIGNSKMFSKERVYFKFNLPSLPKDAEVLSATLNVYVPFIWDLKVPMEVGLYEVLDNWSESSKPDSAPELGEMISQTTLVKGWNQWDLTEYLEGSYSTELNVALKLIDESIENYVWIYSKENPTNRPYLEISYKLPVEIKNLGTVTAVVTGKANVSSEDSALTVSVGGEDYTFELKPGLRNVFVDANALESSEPALLAYWKALVNNYNIIRNSTILYGAVHILERNTTTITVNLSMSDRGFAVVVVPFENGTVASVVVEKDDGSSFELKENDVDNGLGYYYVTEGKVFVVLKKDPTVIRITIVNEAKLPGASPFMALYNMALYYSMHVFRDDPYIEDLYKKFTDKLSELQSYNVSTDVVPVDEITKKMEEYREYRDKIPRDIFDYQKNKYKAYPVFMSAKKAMEISKDLAKELEKWNSIFDNALEKIQAGETNVELPKPRKVLIDASHDQYYVTRVGVNGLIKRINDELSWDVEINDKPLTYELLKDYDVVIILEPKEEFTDSEIKALREYVENGGGLIIASDWYRYFSPSLNEILKGYGAAFEETELMDDDTNSGRPYHPFVGIYNRESPITKFIPDGWMTYYHGCTVRVSGNAVWVIKGFETSYAVDPNGNVVHEKGSTPVVAAAVQAGKGRIVVYGSSRAFSDSYYGKYIASNWPFIKGALLWLVGEI